MSGPPARRSGWPSGRACTPWCSPWAGYVSSTDSTAAQPDSAVTAIGLGFSVVPAVLVAVSLLLLARYRLDEAAVTGATAATTHEEV